jgi:hypothetical protein
MDRGTGRIANATFADYLIPVNADVRELDVVFVGEPDRFNSTGTKGLGEVDRARRRSGRAATRREEARHYPRLPLLSHARRQGEADD